MKTALLLIASLSIYITATAQTCADIVPNFTDSVVGNLSVQFIDHTEATGFSVNKEWDFNDPASGTEDSSGATQPIHTFSAPGTYNVCLYLHSTLFGDTTQQVNCYDTLCKTITVANTTGITDFNTEALSVYPNPTKGQLEIRGWKGSINNIRAHDMLGQTVNIEYSNNTIKLPDDAKNGFYFISIQVGTKTITKRIMLAR